MLCDCGENVFSFTKVGFLNGKKCTSVVSRCNRSLEDSGKKKKKCSYRHEQVISELDTPDICMNVKQDKKVDKIPIREKLVNELEKTINMIKTCQDLNFPFATYTNIIHHLSKRLNIPAYIEENQTIDEYHETARYFLEYPLSKKIYPKPERYSFTNYYLQTLDDNMKDHYRKLLTIDNNKKKIKKVKTITNKFTYVAPVEFRTGGLDEDGENQEDELDIEEFASEDEEEEDYEDLGNYSD